MRAWSVDGHKHIGHIAEELLHGKRKNHIHHLLKGNLLELADWEHVMTKRNPATDVLHWHRQNPEWTCSGVRKSTGVGHVGDKDGHIACDGHGAEDSSLFCALAYFFEHFAHDALLRDYPAPKQPINTPKTLAALNKVPASERTPTHFLRWLVMLVGDLHQPLHWLKDHNYGRDIKLQFRGEEFTLLSFWEDYIPKHLPPLPLKEALQKQYEQRAPGWRGKIPPELFREWAKETGEVVCSQVYGGMEVTTDGTKQVDSPFRLDEERFHRWLDLAHSFTILGGERLAFVLNDILEHKKHKVAHKEGRGRHHPKKSWRASFFSNLLIMLILVPLLILAFKWHADSGVVSLCSIQRHLKL